VSSYDAGEGGVSNGTVLVILAEYVGSSVPMALARKYNGVAVLWEHRFYGESLPFEVDNATGFAKAGQSAYKYLTNEQALEDTVYFAQNFYPKVLRQNWKVLSPSQTPWVFIGGSYPGARAAMIRERNPETWFASWASSAPVEAHVDMSVYYNPLEQSMTRNCSADMHAAIDYADGVLINGTKEEIAEVRHAVYLLGLLNPLVNVTLYNVTGPYPATEVEMTMWVWSQIINYAVQWTTTDYQSNGFAVALLPFCNYLEQYNPAASGVLPSTVTSSDPSDIARFILWLNNTRDGIPSDIGIAASYNASIAFNALLSATYAKMLDDNSTYYPSRTPAQRDTLSWTWQYCSQFGYLQGSNITNPKNLVSRFNNVFSEEQNYCQNIFPYAPPMPNVSSIVSKYGGWRMMPSNVMFSNGELDPWRTLGVQADAKINPSAYVRQSTTEIPTCNQPPKGDQVFGQVYPGQVSSFFSHAFSYLVSKIPK
jgi:Serine carboxypeptidase S28